jgi:hypothetical protein
MFAVLNVQWSLYYCKLANICEQCNCVCCYGVCWDMFLWLYCICCVLRPACPMLQLRGRLTHESLKDVRSDLSQHYHPLQCDAMWAGGGLPSLLLQDTWLLAAVGSPALITIPWPSPQWWGRDSFVTMLMSTTPHGVTSQKRVILSWQCVSHYLHCSLFNFTVLMRTNPCVCVCGGGSMYAVSTGMKWPYVGRHFAIPLILYIHMFFV